MIPVGSKKPIEINMSCRLPHDAGWDAKLPPIPSSLCPGTSEPNAILQHLHGERRCGLNQNDKPVLATPRDESVVYAMK